MLLKLGIGGVAFVAAAYFVNLPTGDPGDPVHVAMFKAKCQRAAGNVAKPYCRCIANRFPGALQSVEEHALAGAIINAIGVTAKASQSVKMDAAAQKQSLQSQFDQLSQKFDGVSTTRKAAVLQTVTYGMKVCTPELQNKSA